MLTPIRHALLFVALLVALVLLGGLIGIRSLLNRLL
ncbi:hypothetical protein HSTV2_50 [Halorubrum sodomense tailed virus 2]|uniref:Uncharacterized protein n=1 Tax=Halorubrum sodomense tailed virus 2 TaxID=1262527 RepID=L7TGL7_9CAUD|nr:hypothetical protein HSTV2_50 [Halorubrum sodomense tailed virus 2]AGC34319.1 hypothetical protein HSTV2_50 [Halorubrum sodomense tailed virus 2]